MRMQIQSARIETERPAVVPKEDRSGELLEFLFSSPFFEWRKGNLYCRNLAGQRGEQLAASTINWLTCSGAYRDLVDQSASQLWEAWTQGESAPVQSQERALDPDLKRAQLQYGVSSYSGDRYRVAQLSETMRLGTMPRLKITNVVVVPDLPSALTVRIPAMMPVGEKTLRTTHMVARDHILSERRVLDPPVMFPAGLADIPGAADDYRRLFQSVFETMLGLERDFRPDFFSGPDLLEHTVQTEREQVVASRQVQTRHQDGRYTIFQDKQIESVNVTLAELTRRWQLGQPVDLLVLMSASDIKRSVRLRELGWNGNQTIGWEVQQAAIRADKHFRDNVQEVCGAAGKIVWGNYAVLQEARLPRVSNQLAFGMALFPMTGMPAALVRFAEENYFCPAAQFLSTDRPVGRFIEAQEPAQ
ncbi:hypothetical protein KKB64_02270 [Patescibacteria group bacterium]|nr:hypothetical protein [Patescibacteria group bacterium]MBU1472594.1 hypothetical protein [Patescibacteria group bacterium]MBU2459846.1 hypothetical protein [Patescibacteria group bacterium]MBU2544093.1 hypothetical protein [Patescibacteria group bacterium]